MAGPLEIAERRYRSGVRLNKVTTRAAGSLWKRGMDGRNLDASWRGIAPLMLALVANAQRQAAEGSDAYVDDVLRAEGIDTDSAGLVNAAALTGVASDGRPLDSLLYSPVTTTKAYLGQGLSASQALARGQAALQLITATQIADAGRVGDGIATAARPRVGGYVRMLSLPSCARCAILAGKYFRWNQGFQRHPRCDCRHIPASEDIAGDLATDPMAAVRSGQVRGLSDADKKALEEGADLNRLVNARRGTYTAGGKQYTRELRSQIRSRITPEQIYRDATSREDAVRLLRLHGYLI